MKTLIKDTQILSMCRDATGAAQPILRGDIAIEDGVIQSVGPCCDPKDFDQVYPGGDTLAMPGLINAHNHVSMSLLRGYADDMLLQKWLSVIFPIEDGLTGEDVYWGAMLSLAEMIRSGTTCFADMYFFMDEVAKAAAESGMRASLSIGISDGSGLKALERSKNFVRKWQGAAEGRITTMFGPHAPYTCSEGLLREVAAAARELKAPIHMHLAETLTEVNQMQERTGKKPLQLAEEYGLMDGHLLAAHVVYADEEEIALLKRHDVSPVHNPVSNMKLASGIAPVRQMLAAGIPVALGTDGPCSNNNLDMFEEIKLAAIAQKVDSCDATKLPAYQALEMATLNGAKALALPDLGQLAPGKKADIILLDLDHPHFYPRHDLVSHLVYAAQGSDVRDVFVDGRPLMLDRKLLTLDEEKIYAEVDRCVERLLGKKAADAR